MIRKSKHISTSAMARNINEKKLSKHLLEMKFMKSSCERIQEEEEKEDYKMMFYNNISDEMKSSSSKYITENSYVVCEGLKCGRRSFKGMNPALERLLELENDDKFTNKKIKEEDVDVTAEEMLKFRQEESTLIETIARKFKRPKLDSDEVAMKKQKLLKPDKD